MQDIQYISIDKTSKCFDSHNFKNPDAFDKYSLNIIDLNSSEVWRYLISGLAHIGELEYLAQLFRTSSKNNTIILIPQNIIYSEYGGKIVERKTDIIQILSKFISIDLPIIRENNTASIQGYNFKADFYFNVNNTNAQVLIKAEKTERALAIKRDNCIVTSLNIKTDDEIKTFLMNIGLLNNNINLPEWLDEYYVFDEESLRATITESKNKIISIQSEIINNEKTINQYKKYKRLLSESGDELVSIVKDVLHEIIGVDFTNFIDDKKEDLRFDYEEKTYLIEIKGTNKNVMRSNITQISSRRDEYVEDYDLKNIKPILIINDQRMTPINNRLPVSEEQIRLANLYDVLVIRTDTLLKILELFRSNYLSKTDFLDILKEQSGLLNLDA